ncbi:MAG TPA: lipopolysaccharide biosynthesis protein [Luteimonas sp.]|nr:lipopolysaccharide biosynthesis protein [Luteimonas sp.]HRP73798.1 lipopolysaccharide biosynthesis protein [Luteimonas sp.]
MTEIVLAGAWLLAGFLIAFAGTAFARRYALRRQLIDLPGERRSHQAATPRGGGISIVLVLLLAALAWAMVEPERLGAIALLSAGLVLVAAIGWIDDHRPLSPWLRLGVHVLAGLLLAAALLQLGAGPVDAVLAFAAAVVLANVWNFMDGIDGLATTQALLVAVAWALFAGTGPVFWLGLALAAGAAGFLPFNFPRARIFLGDVGSGALGYALAALLALLTLGAEPATRLLAVFPLLPFLLDASLTLLSRILRGEAWWRPHVQHAYQAWARRASSHVVVTLGYAGATLASILAMFALRSWSSAIIMSACVTFLAAGGMAWRRLRGASADGGRPDDIDDISDRKP